MNISVFLLTISVVAMIGMLVSSDHINRLIFQFIIMTAISLIISSLGFSFLSLIVFISNIFLSLSFYIFSCMYHNIKSTNKKDFAKWLCLSLFVFVSLVLCYLFKEKYSLYYWDLPVGGKNFNLSQVLFKHYSISIGLMVVLFMSLLVAILFLEKQRDEK